MMTRTWIKFLTVTLINTILLAGMLTGCTQKTSIEEESSEEITSEFTDQLDRKVTLNELPERIISLSPSNTEIIYALGLEDKLIAVTKYCNYPATAKDKANIGGFSTPNIEEIIALSPDLILATSIHEEKIIPQLEEQGMTVFGLNPTTMDEVITSIIMVGEITGKEKEAAEITSDMQKRIKAVTDKTEGLTEEQNPRVCYLVWHDPLTSAGSETLQNELIKNAGGINISEDLSDYAKISLENLIVANPQVIIAGMGMGSGEDLPLQFVNDESRLKDIDARINNNVYGVDLDITGRPGPRIVDALEEFARFIHPELFE
ncbi:ABC transporter substrate-binding protein [Chloroflexota bacterium]